MRAVSHLRIMDDELIELISNSEVQKPPQHQHRPVSQKQAVYRHLPSHPEQKEKNTMPVKTVLRLAMRRGGKQ